MALTKVSRGLVNTSIEDNGNATAITIDSSENVGIGVVPETDWHSNYNALQVNTGGSLASYASGTVFGTALSTNQRTTGNTFVGGNKYIESATAQLYLQDNSGNHIWYNAASGTADATISWNACMKIDAAGRVTTPSQPHIDCHGSSSTPYTYSAGDVISHFSNRSTPVGITRNGGRFTVPVAGRYLLTATLYSYLTGLTHARFNLTRNGTVIGLAQIERAAKLDSQADETVYLHHIVHLAANDYIEIKHDGGGQMYRGYTHNSLQMMLIG